MKTNRLILIVISILIMTSCNTYYRMTSHIHRDGSMHREVYAYGDSAFMSGNGTHNPFLFRIDSCWELVKLDSAIKFNFWGDKQNLNVKLCRDILKIGGEYFRTLPQKEYTRPLVIPYEELKKSFKWFYTYYVYSATYSEIPDKGPIPLDKFMTKEEQDIWFQGGKTAMSGLNGIELSDKLDNIGDKFWQWFECSQYEVSYETIRHFVSLEKRDTAFMNLLSEYKEPVYKKYLSNDTRKEMNDEANPENVCRYFDDINHTKYFSMLYDTNGKAIDSLFEVKTQVMEEMFEYAIQYELVMPGQILSTNATSQKGDSLIWKVDAFRLMSGDYVLTAESRVMNYWAWGFTLLIFLFALGCLWMLFSKRR